MWTREKWIGREIARRRCYSKPQIIVLWIFRQVERRRMRKRVGERERENVRGWRSRGAKITSCEWLRRSDRSVFPFYLRPYVVLPTIRFFSLSFFLLVDTLPLANYSKPSFFVLLRPNSRPLSYPEMPRLVRLSHPNCSKKKASIYSTIGYCLEECDSPSPLPPQCIPEENCGWLAGSISEI